MLKRPEKTAVKPGTQLPSDLCVMLKCPMLVAYLADEAWEDGTSRERSTLTVFIEDGLFKLCLNDREASSSVFASSNSLREAMKQLEKRLDGSMPPDWRPWKNRKRR